MLPPLMESSSFKITVMGPSTTGLSVPEPESKSVSSGTTVPSSVIVVAPSSVVAASDAAVQVQAARVLRPAPLRVPPTSCCDKYMEKWGKFEETKIFLKIMYVMAPCMACLVLWGVSLAYILKASKGSNDMSNNTPVNGTASFNQTSFPNFV